MRDEQVRRYARHVLLPDVGGLGQTALLVATVRVDANDAAGAVAATYLAAGGIGTLVIDDAPEPQRETLAAINPDCHVVREAAPETRVATVSLPTTPHWWPRCPGDEVAAAFWRGGAAATQTMARIVDR